MGLMLRRRFSVITFTVKRDAGQRVSIPSKLLSRVMSRQIWDVTGYEIRCGMAQCGACTIHIDGEAVRSCVGTGQPSCGKESHHHRKGLSADLSHPLQRAWLKSIVPQCGYCQSGRS